MRQIRKVLQEDEETRQLKKKSLKINATLNLIKQLCQVIFPLITVPYVTRVLQPENYGKFNYGNSIVSYFVLIAALGINSYAIREGAGCRDNPQTFSKFVSQAFSINVFSTIISYILLGMVLLFPSMEYYRKIILIQSLVIVLTTFGTDWINTIYEDFGYITMRYLVFQIISLCLMFLFVHNPDDYLIYALIVVSSSAGANILNIVHVRKYVKICFTFSIDWRRHIAPIMIFFVNNVAITIYVNSDITMLGIMQNDKAVGIYTLASKIYSIVKQVLNAVIVVTLPSLSLMIKNRDSFNHLAIRIQKALIILVFPVATGVVFLSKEIIKIVGGVSYIQGKNALIILSGAMVFSLLATFYTSCIMIPLKLEKFVLVATSVSAVTNILLNFFFIPCLGYNGAAITTLISEAIVCSIGGYFSLIDGKVPVEFIFIMKVILGSGVVGIICLMVKSLVSNIYSTIFLSVFLSAIIYFLFELLIRNHFIIEELKLALIGLKRMKRKGHKF